MTRTLSPRRKRFCAGLTFSARIFWGVAASAGGLAENITRARAHPLFEPLAGLGASLESISAVAAGQAAEFDAIAGALAAELRKIELEGRRGPR